MNRSVGMMFMLMKKIEMNRMYKINMQEVITWGTVWEKEAVYYLIKTSQIKFILM